MILQRELSRFKNVSLLAMDMEDFLEGAESAPAFEIRQHLREIQHILRRENV